MYSVLGTRFAGGLLTQNHRSKCSDPLENALALGDRGETIFILFLIYLQSSFLFVSLNLRVLRSSFSPCNFFNALPRTGMSSEA